MVRVTGWEVTDTKIPPVGSGSKTFLAPQDTVIGYERTHKRPGGRRRPYHVKRHVRPGNVLGEMILHEPDPCWYLADGHVTLKDTRAALDQLGDLLDVDGGL
jgi:hypothetical protein